MGTTHPDFQGQASSAVFRPKTSHRKARVSPRCRTTPSSAPPSAAQSAAWTRIGKRD